MTEEQVFLAALDLPDATARAAYLDETCGADGELRRQVEALLVSHFGSGEFLDVPAAEQIKAVATDDRTITIQGDAVPAEKNSDEESDELPFLMPSTRPDSLGRIGHYEVLQVLGKGGFGVVFRAFDDVLQRVVAVKVLAPQLAATSPARKRFLREARASAAVRHENVVQVYEVGEKPLPYLVMEFIPGETLQQRLDRVGPLEVPETLRIGRQIAEGLAAAHATDFIHRDIKPGNILLEGGQHRVKITDFGLARAADDASISQSGIIAGTPMYMAPEQAQGQPLDQRADLFSLGSVLYQMVAGRPPFRANTTVAVLKRVADDTPRAIREIIPETPQWLCDIIAKLHAKNPDDRYQSARHVADVLTDCEAQLKANSKLKVVSRIPRGTLASSGKWKWVAAITMLVALVSVGVYALTRPEANPGGGSPTPAVKPASNEDGWVQLFNGEDLTGWKYHPKMPGAWKVQNGLLTSSGPANFLFSERDDFANFHVRAEVKINAKGNSGLFFRATWNLLDRPDVPRPGGHEAQILGGPGSLNTGSLLEEKDTLSRIAKNFFTPPDEWFILEVIANGNRITIKVNGKTTVDCIEENQIHTTGHIALQQFTPETVVQFRKIEIKELPPGTGALQPNGSLIPFTDADVQRIAALPAAAQVEEVRKELMKRNPDFDGQLRSMHGLAPKMQDGVVVDLRFRADNVSDISPLRALTGLRVFHCCGSEDDMGRLSDLSPLKGMPLTEIWIAQNAKVTDLSPLQGMRLNTMHLGRTGVQSIEIVKQMPISRLWIVGTPVADLSPLAGKTLEFLNMARTVKSLKELRATTIKTLGCDPDQIPSEAELQRLGVKELQVWGDPKAIDPARLRAVGSRLTRINTRPAEEFWKELNPTAIAPFTDADVQRITALPAAAQVEEVRKELMKRNPGFDGRVPHKIEAGVVTELHIVMDQVTDIAPIRVWSALRSLDCSGTQTDSRSNGQLADLTPLAGMNLASLTYLNLFATRVGDSSLGHFKACKGLTTLYLGGTRASDAGLAYFKDCKDLRVLGLTSTYVTDAGLAYFKDCKGLTSLYLGGTSVSDAGLATFKDCKDLMHLELDNTKVSDAGLANFKDCKSLKLLKLKKTQIGDRGLAYFKDCVGLRSLDLGSTNVSDTGLAYFKDCKDLRLLDLGSTQASDPALANFKNCQDLTVLLLNDTKVSDAGLANFKDCKSLTLIDVRKTKVTAAKIDELKKTLPKCKIVWDGGMIEPR